MNFGFFSVSFVLLMIVLQHLTDLFDGEVGRRRNTGVFCFVLPSLVINTFQMQRRLWRYDMRPKN